MRNLFAIFIFFFAALYSCKTQDNSGPSEAYAPTVKKTSSPVNCQDIDINSYKIKPLPQVDASKLQVAPPISTLNNYNGKAYTVTIAFAPVSEPSAPMEADYGHYKICDSQLHCIEGETDFRQSDSNSEKWSWSAQDILLPQEMEEIVHIQVAACAIAQRRTTEVACGSYSATQILRVPAFSSPELRQVLTKIQANRKHRAQEAQKIVQQAQKIKKIGSLDRKSKEEDTLQTFANNVVQKPVAMGSILASDQLVQALKNTAQENHPTQLALASGEVCMVPSHSLSLLDTTSSSNSSKYLYLLLGVGLFAGGIFAPFPLNYTMLAAGVVFGIMGVVSFSMPSALIDNDPQGTNSLAQQLVESSKVLKTDLDSFQNLIQQRDALSGL